MKTGDLIFIPKSNRNEFLNKNATIKPIPPNSNKLVSTEQINNEKT